MLITPITTEDVLAIIQTCADVINSFKIPIMLVMGVYLGIYVLQAVLGMFGGKRTSVSWFPGLTKKEEQTTIDYYNMTHDDDDELWP